MYISELREIFLNVVRQINEEGLICVWFIYIKYIYIFIFFLKTVSFLYVVHYLKIWNKDLVLQVYQ